MTNKKEEIPDSIFLCSLHIFKCVRELLPMCLQPVQRNHITLCIPFLQSDDYKIQ